MSKSLRQIFVSVESEENDITDTTVVVSSDQTIEDEVAEVTEAGIEVIEAEDDVEQLHEIAEGLESIVASLEASIEDGGLDAQAAVFMQHAVNGYTRRVGLEAESFIPSLESFGGASGKAAATTISVESVKDKIKQIWQAIKNAVAKAIQATMNFFAKIFGGFEKLKSRVAGLRAEIKKISNNDKPKTDTIKVSGVHLLATSDTVTTQSITSDLTKTASTIDTLFTKYVPGANDVFKGYGDLIKLAIEKKGDVTEQHVKIINNFANMVKSISSEPLIGGYKLNVKDISARNSGTGEKQEIHVPSFERGEVSKTVKEEIKTPSVSEMGNILNSVEKLIDAASKNARKDAIKKMREEREKTVKSIDSTINSANDGAFDKMISKFVFNSSIKHLNKQYEKPLTQASNIAFNVSRAALSVVDRAVKAYG